MIKELQDKLKELIEQGAANDQVNGDIVYTNESKDMAEVSTRIIPNANLSFQAMRHKYISQMSNKEDILQELIDHEDITMKEAYDLQEEYRKKLANELLN
jgi:predicted transcriptional regulator